MNNGSSSHRHSSSHHHHSSHSSYSQPYGYGVSSGSKRRAFKRNILSSKKNKHSMKKSNKLKLIIAIIVCILILLAIAVYEIYTAVILPNYVKPVLEDVVTVMQDDTYTSGITKEIQRLYDIGQISGPEVERYLELHSGNAESGNTDNTEVQNSGTEASEPVLNDTSTGSDSLGINSVKVIEEGSSGGSAAVHYYSSGNKGNQSSKPDNTVSMSELQTMSSDELYAKAKSIMSAEDFSAAMALRSKISVSKVKELRSDPNALMQYIQTVLTADEYSNMLYIYAKYSNHLTN